MKYTCPCCGYKTLDEEPQVPMIYAKFAFGKMYSQDNRVLLVGPQV